MEATTSPGGHLLIEYTEEDCERYNGTRRGYHTPVEESRGLLLFGPQGEVKYPRRLTEPEWFMADWLRDLALDGDRRAG